MDTQQVTEKLFNFCQENHPDLEWAWNCSCRDINGCKIVAYILSSYSNLKVVLEICSDKKQQEVFSYKEETTYDYIQGWIDVLQLEKKISTFLVR